MGAAPTFFQTTTGHPFQFDPRSILFVADATNHAIRRVDPTNGVTTTFAGTLGVSGNLDGAGLAARFRKPSAVVASTSALFVADTENHVIRRVNFNSNHSVTTIAGIARKRGLVDGTGSSARFDRPAGLAHAPDSNLLYVADTGNSLIRRVSFNAFGVASVDSISTGWVDADAGGSAPATFNRPTALVFDETNDRLYIADSGNHAVRAVNVQNGQVSTLAGELGVYGSSDGAPGLLARPTGLALTSSALYIADGAAGTIRRVELDGSRSISTLSGSPGKPGNTNGSGAGASFRAPAGIAAVGSELCVADQGNHLIRKVNLDSGQASALVGVGGLGGASDGWPQTTNIGMPAGLACAGDHLYLSALGQHAVHRVTGAVRTLSPLTIGTNPGVGVAVTTLNYYHVTSYGFVGINLQSLERTTIFEPTPDLQTDFGPMIGIGPFLYYVSRRDPGIVPTTAELFEDGPDGTRLIPATVDETSTRLAASATHVYFADSSRVYRFPIGTTGPIEELTGYTPGANVAFGVDESFIYLTDGTQIARAALPSVYGGSVGQPSAFAGSASEAGATDGDVAEARFSALAGTASFVCYADRSLYALERLTASTYRVRWLNLTTNTVSTIVANQCTRVLLEDFADGLTGWTYHNGTPGDRGSKWEAYAGAARYTFFYEPGEGAASSQQSLSRNFVVRPLAAGGTRMVWDFSHAYWALDGLIGGSFEVRVTPQGACSSHTPAVHEFTWGPGAEGRGEVSGSVDVSAFEGCPVEFRAVATNFVAEQWPQELNGWMQLDDVRLEAAACPE